MSAQNPDKTDGKAGADSRAGDRAGTSDHNDPSSSSSDDTGKDAGTGNILFGTYSGFRDGLHARFVVCPRIQTRSKIYKDSLFRGIRPIRKNRFFHLCWHRFS